MEMMNTNIGFQEQKIPPPQEDDLMKDIDFDNLNLNDLNLNDLNLSAFNEEEKINVNLQLNSQFM